MNIFSFELECKRNCMGVELIKSFDYNNSDLLIVGNILPGNRKHSKGCKFDVFP